MGKSLSYNGVWSNAVSYDVDDVVFFNGSSYVSLVNGNLNFSPDVSPADWAIFAAQGQPGAQGPAGATGPTGPQGPAGVSNVFSTTNPVNGATLSLPAGIYFVSASISVHFAAQGTGYTVNLTGGILQQGQGDFTTFQATVNVQGGQTFDQMVQMQGVVTLTQPNTLILSASSPNFNSLQFQALQVGSVTQQ